MTMLIAVALWSFHGVILLWNWGKYRPHIALLHGVGVALVAALAWPGLPSWALYAAGALVGFVAGRGHRLAPGLFPGIGLLLVAAFVMRSVPLLMNIGPYALAAQAAAVVASLSRSDD